MPLSIKKAKELISSIPRVELGFFPTPLHKLDNLSQILGINLYIKRDDFTGKNLFGGNKTRKLEFLIGKAVNEKCEYVFTYGATQSNHAMQTVWAASANNLKTVLYLAAVVEPDENDIKANLLLDMIFDAEINIVSLREDETFEEAVKRSLAMGAEHIKRLEAEGHKCMDITMGGANEVGTAGYVSGFVELCEQAEQMGLNFDYLYHATGSGGTMAGLVAGKKLLGMDTIIKSIAVLETDDNYISSKTALANSALEYIKATPNVEEKDFNLDTNFYAPGYECPNEGATEAIKLLAKKEGVLLDPVYTGKAFAGLIYDVRTGKIEQGSNVVFLHTGGATALFAEKEILGSLF
jgi:L-cysteate sulfo-lyase